MKYKHFFITPILVSSITLAISCKNSPPTPDENTSGSGLASTNITIPADFPLRDKLTGYTLIVVPTNCPDGVTGTSINATKKMADTIADKVVSACNYTFTLSLGILSADDSKLTSVYFESGPLPVNKDQLKTSPVSISIKLTPTAAGKAAGAPDRSITTPVTTDVEIKPEVDTFPVESGKEITIPFAISSGTAAIKVPNDFDTLATRKPEDACIESKQGTFAFSADGTRSWICELDPNDKVLVWDPVLINKAVAGNVVYPLTRAAWYQYERDNQTYIGHVALYENSGFPGVAFSAQVRILKPNTKIKDCATCEMKMLAWVLDKKIGIVKLFSSITNDHKILQPMMKYENGQTRVYLDDENGHSQELKFVLIP